MSFRVPSTHCSLGHGQTYLAQNKLSTFEAGPSRMGPFPFTRNGRHLAWDLSENKALGPTIQYFAKEEPCHSY